MNSLFILSVFFQLRWTIISTTFERQIEGHSCILVTWHKNQSIYVKLKTVPWKLEFNLHCRESMVRNKFVCVCVCVCVWRSRILAHCFSALKHEGSIVRPFTWFCSLRTEVAFKRRFMLKCWVLLSRSSVVVRLSVIACHNTFHRNVTAKWVTIRATVK
jgi:hypothetical protein